MADDIAARAIRHDDEVSWLVYSMSASGWGTAVTDISMYDGLAGIALFYAYLGEVTGETRYTALAEAALRALQGRLALYRPVYESIGGFEGWGSVIYSLTHLGALWRRPALWDEAEALTETLAARIDKDGRLDVIAGAAGAIAALLALHRVRPSARALAAAVRCGEHLLAQAERMPVGVGWKNHIARRVPLTGFSHGTAGIAWALLQLTEAAGDARFRATALEALAYERSLFEPGDANWRDLRLAQRPDVDPAACGCGMAWCHGAPGIGLGRLLALPYLDTPEVRAEIETAVRTTLAQGVGADHPGFGPNYSLCHGDFGNLETLLVAARLPAYAGLQAAIDARAAAVLAGIEARGWLCGVPQGLETPGLMTGMAGIGYGLLRLAAPERLPSVLGLEPPVGG